LAFAEFSDRRFVGVDGHTAPFGAGRQRVRSGQVTQVCLGKCTVLPAWNGMLAPARQVSCPAGM
jgi:hypothetical protein